MTFRIISTTGPTRGLVYRTFDLKDGVLTIGVMPGEEYAVQWSRPTLRGAKVILSIDGLNPRTGRQALEDPDDVGYPFSATADHWDETGRGGGAFRFTADAKYAVATYQPGVDLAPGYISACFFEEVSGLRQHPTGFAGGSGTFPMQQHPGYHAGYQDGDALKSPVYRDSASRSAGAGAPATMDFGAHVDASPDMSTGIGDHIEAQLLPNPILRSGHLVGYHQVRYVPLEALRGLMTYHPRGFQARQVVDLGSVPRMSSEIMDENRFVVPGTDRFQLA